MRNKFDEQLDLLNVELIKMGALCEEAIAAAAKSIFDTDPALRSATLSADEEIDHKEREIESLCLNLLLQQQPVAKDLRVVSSALKMISDMERIGDQASDIAEIVPFLGNRSDEGNLHLKDMASAVISMVTTAIDSFVKKDFELAKSVITSDDNVDELFNKVKDELIEIISGGAENAEACVDYLMIAKYFERIGDHATNIADWVIYSIIGKHLGE